MMFRENFRLLMSGAKSREWITRNQPAIQGKWRLNRIDICDVWMFFNVNSIVNSIKIFDGGGLKKTRPALEKHII